MNFSKAAFIIILFCTKQYAAFAQNDYTVSIQNSFNDYSNNTLQEKIYVHTDKSFYLAGEILWFKLYCVDGAGHRPLDVSKVAYVEILDKDNKPVMQSKTGLNKGKGNGSFYLPVSVNSGNYLLRAYTSWMKNSGPGYFFEKSVTIVNSLKPLDIPSADTASGYRVSFFPEGGNLVKDITGKVAFKVTDRYGQGVDCTGLLVNENNDTITSFRSLKFGMGHFVFTPAGNHTYKAIIHTPGGKFVTQQLPAVAAEGYVMQVSDEGPSLLRVTVTTNVPPAMHGEVFLFAHTRQVMKLSEKKSFVNGQAVFTIDKDKLGNGISQLTIFNSARQPVCERLYFKKPAQVLTIDAGSGSQRYTARKRVLVTINTKTENVVPANLSMAVYRLDSLQASDDNTIVSYLWLGSDLKGAIESPGYYFSSNSTEVTAALDNLMLTHGWRKFNWDAVLNNGAAAFEYVPEYDGHIIRSRVTDPSTGNPLPEITLNLSIPGFQTQFYPAASNNNGIASFAVRDYYGQNEVVVQAVNYTNSDYRINVLNPFSEEYSNTVLLPLQLPADRKRILTDYSIGMQVQNTYHGQKLSRFAVPGIDTLPFYGKANRRYMLDDYVRFTTMEEVLREYVPDVAVRRYDGEYHLLVLSWELRQFYQHDPLILLDGVAISNKKIIEYDPLKVKKLEVVTNRYIIGDNVYEGIVNFTTYQGNLDELQLDPKTVKMDYDGLQLNREFYSPEYPPEQLVSNRLPDFRTLLQWSPNIETDAAGNARIGFYTSDIPGKYIAVLQGIDNNGNAGSYSFTFDVIEQ